MRRDVLARLGEDAVNETEVLRVAVDRVELAERAVASLRNLAETAR